MFSSLLFWGRVWKGLVEILYFFSRIYQWSHLVRIFFVGSLFLLLLDTLKKFLFLAYRIFSTLSILIFMTSIAFLIYSLQYLAIVFLFCSFHNCNLYFKLSLCLWGFVPVVELYFSTFCSSLNFIKTDILNSLFGKSKIYIFESDTRRLLASFDDVTFFWFSIFLNVLCCCHPIWNSVHLLQLLLTAFWREISSISPIRDLMFSHTFYGRSDPCFLLCFMANSYICMHSLSPVVQWNRCWQPSLYFLNVALNWKFIVSLWPADSC